jgi:L-aminopeptidase/D-esterase-like protein
MSGWRWTPQPTHPSRLALSPRAASGRAPAAEALAAAGIADAPDEAQPAGSCVIVLATDAALDDRQLERVAMRAFAGMARTGSDFSGRSGDYAHALSTAPACPASQRPMTVSGR